MFDDLLDANRRYRAQFHDSGVAGKAAEGPGGAHVHRLAHRSARRCSACVPATPRSSATPARGSPTTRCARSCSPSNLLDVKRVCVMQHTDCAMAGRPTTRCAARIDAPRSGVDASGWDFLATHRPAGDAARRHRAHPRVPAAAARPRGRRASSSTCTPASCPVRRARRRRSPGTGGSFPAHERHRTSPATTSPSTRPTVRCGCTRRSRRASARGAIVVVQEAFGVNPHIEDVTRRAAAAGYHAVAPDFFHRSGPGRGRRVRQVRPGDGVLPGARERRLDPRRRRRRARPPARGAGFADEHDRARRLLLRRAGLVPRRAARARSARAVGLLRRRHRHRALPAVPGARRRGRVAADAVARAVRRPGRRRSRSTTSSSCGPRSSRPRSTPRSCATPTPATDSTATSAPTTGPTTPPTRGGARSTGSRRTS